MLECVYRQCSSMCNNLPRLDRRGGVHATPAKRLTTQTMFPVFIVVEGPMEGSVGSMARRSKTLCFSMSNRGVGVDLTWKN